MPDELPCTYADATLHSSGRQGPLPLTLGTAACDDTTTTLGGDPGDGETVFDPALLAEQARAAMDLPAPSIGTAPPVGAPRFVQIPSWMWIDARDWSPVSATASVGAGSVTVSATPQQITWDTGDGNEVVCQAPGTVFSPDLHSDQGSPDCGHTYTSLPSGGAGAPIDLTADWEWDVTWSTTDGQGGGLAPLTTYSSVTVTVSEIHAVVTDVG